MKAFNNIIVLAEEKQAGDYVVSKNLSRQRLRSQQTEALFVPRNVVGRFREY